MRCTVSANYSVWRWCFLVFLVGYVSYLFVDHVLARAGDAVEIVEQKRVVAQSTAGRHTALVLGGSNAFYSVSAAQLTEMTGMRWLNLSLPQEAHSWLNYLNFLRDSNSQTERNNIDRVIYSSIDPLVKGRSKKRMESKMDAAGRRSFGLRPSRSLGLRLLELATGRQPDRRVIDDAGDLDRGSFECRANIQTMPLSLEDPGVAASEMIQKAKDLGTLYPHARILISVPSFLPSGPGGEAISDASIYGWRIALQRELLGKMPLMVKVVFEPAFPSEAYICDAIHHANLMGRRWRTSMLVGLMDK